MLIHENRIGLRQLLTGKPLAQQLRHCSRLVRGHIRPSSPQPPQLYGERPKLLMPMLEIRLLALGIS